MALELMYTSVPRGLKPGSTGFATVAVTSGMPAPMIQRLENLSGYRPIYPLGSPHQDRNPPEYAHWQVGIGGRYYSVLSFVRFAGADYSGRSNKFAHHVVLDGEEMSPAGPTWVMMQPGFFRSEWGQPPQMLPPRNDIPRGQTSAARCALWDQHAGDAGWAGAMVESFLLDASRPVYVIRPIDLDPRPLIHEALSLLPAAARWRATFSTYFNSLPAGMSCAWRFCIAGSDAAQQASAQATSGLIIDLTQPGPLTRDSKGKYVQISRGQLPAEPVRAAVPVSVKPELLQPVGVGVAEGRDILYGLEGDHGEPVPPTVDQEYEIPRRRGTLVLLALAAVALVGVVSLVGLMKWGTEVPAEVTRLAGRLPLPSASPPAIPAAREKPVTEPSVPTASEPEPESRPIDRDEQLDEVRRDEEPRRNAETQPAYTVVTPQSLASIQEQLSADLSQPDVRTLTSEVTFPKPVLIKGLHLAPGTFQLKLPTPSTGIWPAQLPGLPFQADVLDSGLAILLQQAERRICLLEARVQDGGVMWEWRNDIDRAIVSGFASKLKQLNHFIAFSLIGVPTASGGFKWLQLRGPTKVFCNLDDSKSVSVEIPPFEFEWRYLEPQGWHAGFPANEVQLATASGTRVVIKYDTPASDINRFGRARGDQLPERVTLRAILETRAEKPKRDPDIIGRELEKLNGEVQDAQSQIDNVNAQRLIEERKKKIPEARQKLDTAKESLRLAEQDLRAAEQEWNSHKEVQDLNAIDRQIDHIKSMIRHAKDPTMKLRLDGDRQQKEAQWENQRSICNSSRAVVQTAEKLKRAKSRVESAQAEVSNSEIELNDKLAPLEQAFARGLQTKTNRHSDASRKRDDKQREYDAAKRVGDTRQKIEADLKQVDSWRLAVLAKHSGAVIAEIEIKNTYAAVGRRR